MNKNIIQRRNRQVIITIIHQMEVRKDLLKGLRFLFIKEFNKANHYIKI